MIKSFKKIFAIMLSVFMLSLFTISAFALENVSTMLDGHFPDYASYWYNSFDDKTEFDLLVLVNTSGKSQTGITIGVNSFGSQTAVYYRVYNADTGRLLYKADNQADYLWNVEGLNQVVLQLPTCRMYKVKCFVISFPENTSERVMVWTY